MMQNKTVAQQLFDEASEIQRIASQSVNVPSIKPPATYRLFHQATAILFKAADACDDLPDIRYSIYRKAAYTALHGGQLHLAYEAHKLAVSMPHKEPHYELVMAEAIRHIDSALEKLVNTPDAVSLALDCLETVGKSPALETRDMLLQVMQAGFYWWGDQSGGTWFSVV